MLMQPTMKQSVFVLFKCSSFNTDTHKKLLVYYV